MGFDATKIKKGLFIVIDGNEGAGKTTLINALVEYYKALDIPVITRKDPGDTAISERMRSLVKDPTYTLDANQRLMLFHCARIALIREVILPALEKGIVVFCDRFTGSTFAMQGHTENCDPVFMERCFKHVSDLVTPDLEIVTTVDYDQMQVRIGGRKEIDYYDNLGEEFHKKVKEGFIEYVSNSELNTLYKKALGEGYIGSLAEFKQDAFDADDDSRKLATRILVDQSSEKDFFDNPDVLFKHVKHITDPLVLTHYGKSSVNLPSLLKKMFNLIKG